MADLALRGITKRFPDGTVAVHPVDLTVEDGELMVLVGPSGCGKSTVLRMVAGLEAPTGGTISIGGRLSNDLSPGTRDVAMVFQDYALYPHMTAYANIAFALKPTRLAKREIDGRVRQVAGLLGIEHLLGRRPRALSGGERQRVAMGRAIVRPVGFPHGRAAFEPRRQAAGGAAHGDTPSPRRVGHDVPLRHPRPGGGHDHG